MSQTEYDRDIVMLCYTFDRDEIAITIIRAFLQKTYDTFFLIIVFFLLWD